MMDHEPDRIKIQIAEGHTHTRFIHPSTHPILCMSVSNQQQRDAPRYLPTHLDLGEGLGGQREVVELLVLLPDLDVHDGVPAPAAPRELQPACGLVGYCLVGWGFEGSRPSLSLCMWWDVGGKGSPQVANEAVGARDEQGLLGGGAGGGELAQEGLCSSRRSWRLVNE